jgi:hypothetical protein
MVTTSDRQQWSDRVRARPAQLERALVARDKDKDKDNDEMPIRAGDYVPSVRRRAGERGE